jgi:hypothetical protein
VIEAIKNIFAVVVVGAIALFIFGKSENEKQDAQRAADYKAERAWKDLQLPSSCIIHCIQPCTHKVGKKQTQGNKCGGLHTPLVSTGDVRFFFIIFTRMAETLKASLSISYDFKRPHRWLHARTRERTTLDPLLG